MTVSNFRESLEQHQVVIYFAAVIVAALAAVLAPALGMLETAINPALALMLFATFLQVPLAELGRAFRQLRFMAALLIANFVVVPLIVLLLIQFLPPDPLIRLGVLIVLLAPCIDYVVTFSHLGRADARGLLAATPLLLGVQMLLLPIYLGVMLGPDSRDLIQIEPFVHAFVWLIAVPLLLAGLVQFWGRISKTGARASDLLGLLPVPATALVLFIVICAVVPQLDAARASALQVLPVYIAFAVMAPIAGLIVGRLFRLPAARTRAVAFSAATRNSLVVLPLGLAVPGAVPILPAIIVTQTLVELLSELVYIRLISKAGRDLSAQQA
ncbi:Bile acid:sodium symporter [Mesorhizobium metallidurans STM 2683]|uniref:Bile acid:sodium symporter n=1 Tax=Mesorhizobium metallidurans STM 2683 TaxID=1297569 RepID=M5EN57_9HYPH|nr:arsenic resistance protein [Mesorhizobium metallidurans]CCV05767.1 Bile acid:sodium symporter [Mesorhizobium metallidurans STM 2683]